VVWDAKEKGRTEARIQGGAEDVDERADIQGWMHAEGGICAILNLARLTLEGVNSVLKFFNTKYK